MTSEMTQMNMFLIANVKTNNPVCLFFESQFRPVETFVIYIFRNIYFQYSRGWIQSVPPNGFITRLSSRSFQVYDINDFFLTTVSQKKKNASDNKTISGARFNASADRWRQSITNLSKRTGAQSHPAEFRRKQVSLFGRGFYKFEIPFKHFVVSARMCRGLFTSQYHWRLLLRFRAFGMWRFFLGHFYI